MRKLSDAEMIFQNGLFFDEAPSLAPSVVSAAPKPPSDRNASVEFRFDAAKVVVDPSDEDHGFQSVSNRIWRGSLLVASLIHSRPIALRGKDELELGCGRGLVGLVCGALGAAKSVLSDCDDRPLKALLRHASDKVQIRHFVWESDIPDNFGRPTRHWSNAHRNEEIPEVLMKIAISSYVLKSFFFSSLVWMKHST